jgi:hypothetical protein
MKIQPGMKRTEPLIEPAGTMKVIYKHRGRNLGLKSEKYAKIGRVGRSAYSILGKTTSRVGHAKTRLISF